MQFQNVAFTQQKVQFERIEKEDGTSLSHVFNIFEDKEGFIWFCTNRGLAKFDGYNFKYFRYQPDDTTSLSNAWIHAGLSDSRGRIWVATRRGLNLMDRRTEKFTRFFHEPDNEFSLPSSNLRDVFEDSKQQIWVGAMDGICRYDEEKRKFIRYPAKDLKGHRYGPKFYEDKAGTIWVTANIGLYKINPTKQIAEQVLPIDDLMDATYRTWYTKGCTEDLDGNILVTTPRGVWRYFPKTGAYEHVKFTSPLVNASSTPIIEYKNGEVLIGCNKHGLLHYDLAQNKILNHFTRASDERDGLTINAIYSLMVDSRENLWVGLFNGANKISWKGKNFQLYQNVVGRDDLRNYALEVYGSPFGGVWVRSMRGVYHRPSLNAPAQKIVTPQIKDEDYSPMKSFFQNDPQTIWYTNAPNGVFYYDLIKKKEYAVSSFNKKHLSDSPDVTSYHENAFPIRLTGNTEAPDFVWISCPRGLCKLNKKDFSEQWFLPQNDIPNLKSNRVGRGVSTDKETLWFMIQNSLLRFDTQKEKFFHYPLRLQDSILNKRIYDITTQNGQLWISLSDYLVTYDETADSLVFCKDETGNFVKGGTAIEVDQSGNLWYARNGISTFSPQENYFKNFNTSSVAEGLINGNASQTANGTMIFPGIRGMLAFHPDSVRLDSVPPKIILQNIKVNNEALAVELAPEFVNSLELNWNEKVVTFEYAGLKYRRVEDIQYKIMLEGFDEDWRNVGTKRDATYTNLSPGDYQFKIHAANADGIWTKKPKVIHLKVLPAYWQTNWFFALILLSVCGVIYLIYKNRQHTQKLAKEKAIAEQSTEYKSRFLANMSHEIRTPMNAIVGMSKLILETSLNEKQQEYAKIVQQSAENLLVIINDILDQSKIESGNYSFVKKPFELHILMEQLHRVFAFRMEEKSLDFTIKIAKNIPSNLIGDATRLNQILMNLMGNAIKFTEKGSVTVSLSNQSETPEAVTILFAVKDSGLGIKPEDVNTIFESFQQIKNKQLFDTKGSGLGLSISKQLVEEQGGKIWVNSQFGVGSTFYFQLSFAKSQQPTTVKSTNNLPEPRLADLQFLVAEDTLFNQMLAVELLKKNYPNSQIEVADNGQIALEKLRQKDYDLILMDVKMPVMDGLEATQIIRKMDNPRKKTIPILGVTANAIPEQLEQCKKVGMNDFVTKPINSEDLFGKINEYL